MEKEIHVLNRVASNEAVPLFETSRLSKTRGLVEVSVSVTPLCGGDGRVAGHLRIERDVTLQKESEREFSRLKKLYAGLAQVNQAIVFSKSRDELLDRVCRALVEDGDFIWHGSAGSRIHVPSPAGCGSGRGSGLCQLDHGLWRRPGRGARPGRHGLPHRPAPCVRGYREGIEHGPVAPGVARVWLSARSRAFRYGQRHDPRRLVDVRLGVNFFQDKEMGLLEEAAGDLSYALTSLESEGSAGWLKSQPAMSKPSPRR